MEIQVHFGGSCKLHQQSQPHQYPCRLASLLLEASQAVGPSPGAHTDPFREEKGAPTCRPVVSLTTGNYGVFATKQMGFPQIPSQGLQPPTQTRDPCLPFHMNNMDQATSW